MLANELKIDIEIKDIDLVKNLVALLEIYFKELPIPLQKQLILIEENGLNDFTVKDFNNMFPDMEEDKIECSHKSVLSVNKILKKIKRFNINGEYIEYPSSFYLKYDGKTIIEWGNND